MRENTKLQVLHLIGKYKYLTKTQLRILGASTNTYLPKILDELEENRFLNVKKYAGSKGRNKNWAEKAEHIYSLTDKSVYYLSKNDLPHKKPSIHKDETFYLPIHRIGAVTIQLRYEQWCKKHDIESITFDTYLEGSWNKFDAWDGATSACLRDGKPVEPDLIFCFNRSRPYPFLVEIERGIDTTKAVDTCKKIEKAVKQGIFTEKYKWGKGPRVMVVIDAYADLKEKGDGLGADISEPQMFKVMEQMRNDPVFQTKHGGEIYWFVTLKEIIKGLDCEFYTFNGEVLKLIDLL